MSGVADLAAGLGDEEAARALVRWANLQGVSVRPVVPRWKSSGWDYTGAALAAVTVTPGPGIVVVKVCPAVPRAEYTSPERAWHIAPDFAQRHLAKQVFAPCPLGDGRLLTFHSPAGGSLMDVQVMARLDWREAIAAFRTVVTGLVTDWNRGFENQRVEDVSVSRFLRGELGELLDEDGEVRAYAAGVDAFLLDARRAAWIEVDGVVVPNPLVMALANSQLPNPRFQVVHGLAHSDLHLQNVMVPFRQGRLRSEAYQFIDLANFAEAAPLTRDIATLMLSVIAKAPELAPLQDRVLPSYLVNPQDTQGGPLPIFVTELVDGMHAVGADVVPDSWREPWTEQLLLSVQAAALRFTTYEALGDARRWRFFRLAACAGGELLSRHGTAPPLSARQITSPLPTVTVTLARRPAREPVAQAGSLGEPRLRRHSYMSMKAETSQGEPGSKDLVRRATRTRFRALATDMTVRQIAESWQNENFAPVPEDELRYTDTSVRRRTFESYAAAVDWSDHGHAIRALRVFEDIIRTGLREGWHGPWLQDISQRLESDGLSVDEQGRITGLPAPQPRSAAGTDGLPQVSPITEVTRRRIFDLLRRQHTAWPGGLDEIAFLSRLYDLQTMPSNDPRFTTAERDIIQHRYNNHDWEYDWVYEDARFALLQGPDDTLLRFLAEMLHPAVRTDADEVQQLLRAFNEALARDGYALVQADTISGYPVYRGRPRNAAAPEPRQQRRTPPQPAGRPRPTARPEEPPQANTGAPADPTTLVRQYARGERKDYACDRLPIPHGGQADVFRATHKPTGAIVALKQLRDKYPPLRKTARMAREIDLGRQLDGHPHAMPVLDADPNHRWFVMPYAQTTAEHCQQELSEPAALKNLLDALCSVLAKAHQAGWVHRDIKPANILRLDGRWMLADWGIVRRPRGQTTDAQRTRVGARFGSDGFAAPELSQDAHAADKTADIYSLGQLIGWAITGTMPQINVPLIPKTGPWRTIVRTATQWEPTQRPATIEDFQRLIEQETETPPQPPILRGETLRQALKAGSPTAARDLITLAAAHTDDAPLYGDLLVNVPADSLTPALLATPDQAVEVVRAMAALLGTHRPLERGEVDTTIMWLITIARKAADAGELDLLEECCNGAFEWDAAWDQWTPQEHIARWLPTLTADSASSVAAILRRHPACAAHFRHLTTNFHVDHRIRAAIDSATTGERSDPAV